MLLGTEIMLFWMPKLCRPIQMTGDNGYIPEQKRSQIGIIYAKASGEWPSTWNMRAFDASRGEVVEWGTHLEGKWSMKAYASAMSNRRM